MKKILWLFLKATILGFGVYLLLHNIHNALWLSIGYPSIKILNVLLVSNFLDIVFIAISFLIAIKVLYKNNKELIEQNINKLLILFFITFSFFSILIIFVFNNSLFPRLFYLLFIWFLLSVYFKILFRVFFLRKSVKFFWWTIGIFLSVCILHFFIYIIIFNNAYKNTKLPENFYLYPTINIAKELKPNQKFEGNSAEKVIELLNSLKDREISKNSANEDVILPTQSDLKILEEIANKEYLSWSKQYVSEDVLFNNAVLIININKLRPLAKGIVQLSDTQIVNGQYGAARKNLVNLLIFSHQLINDKDDQLPERLSGIKIAELSGTNLITLNDSNTEIIKKYLLEVTEILANTRVIVHIAISLGAYDSIYPYSPKEIASFLKYFEKYNTESELNHSLMAHNLYLVEMPTYGKISYLATEMTSQNIFKKIWYVIAVSFFEQLNKVINSGSNYVLYHKIVQINESNNTEALEFILNNDFNTFWKKYHEDQEKLNNIYKELIPE